MFLVREVQHHPHLEVIHHLNQRRPGARELQPKTRPNPLFLSSATYGGPNQICQRQRDFLKIVQIRHRANIHVALTYLAALRASLTLVGEPPKPLRKQVEQHFVAVQRTGNDVRQVIHVFGNKDVVLAAIEREHAGIGVSRE